MHRQPQTHFAAILLFLLQARKCLAGTPGLLRPAGASVRAAKRKIQFRFAGKELFCSLQFWYGLLVLIGIQEQQAQEVVRKGQIGIEFDRLVGIRQSGCGINFVVSGRNLQSREDVFGRALNLLLKLRNCAPTARSMPESSAACGTFLSGMRSMTMPSVFAISSLATPSKHNCSSVCCARSNLLARCNKTASW